MTAILRINNYKCLRKTAVTLGRLTVLTGVNGGGKSSVIQALLFLRACFENREAVGALRTISCGDLFSLNLGHAPDLLNIDADDDDITIAFEGPTELQRVRLKVRESLPNSQRLVIEERTPERHTVLDGEDRPAPNKSTEGGDDDFLSAAFTYLNAERIGPRGTYQRPVHSPNPTYVGPHGEYTAAVLSRQARVPVSAARAASEPASGTPAPLRLLPQVEQWMQGIAPGFRLSEPGLVGHEAYHMTFGTAALQTVAPINTGFGISYTLPIFVAGLLAPPGSILVVENPEAHLHPAAQSYITRFLAKVAADGVRVVVETHSDHVLNAVRIAVRRSELDAGDVEIHFFKGQRSNASTSIESPRLDAEGHIDSWPEGFFDEFDNSLEQLF